MKYVVLEYVRMCLPCITLFFYVFARFSTKHRRTGAIWRTGVTRDILDGELGSKSNLAITD